MDQKQDDTRFLSSAVTLSLRCVSPVGGLVFERAKFLLNSVRVLVFVVFPRLARNSSKTLTGKKPQYPQGPTARSFRVDERVHGAPRLVTP